MSSRNNYWTTVTVTALCVLLVIGAAMTYLQAHSNDVYLRDKDAFPSTSIAESQERRAFSHALVSIPQTIELHGKTYTVREAWLEQRMQPTFKYIWFKHREPVNESLLVFTAEGLPHGVAVRLHGQDAPMQRQSNDGMALMSGSTGKDAAAGRAPLRLRFHRTNNGVIEQNVSLREITLVPIQ